ncbi:MAG TPA: DUF1700 domain-containing protein [Candidatus Mediterraneibacter excrementigallinarum]|nr:DUF1700 domain-containing protein [Candidatus Mediterraneibacter excrementigallinarum]
MTKTEYMKVLSKKLRRLPKEDYERAVEYFEEYFADAGPENEQKAIEDLGTPEEAARELIMDLAEENADKPPKTVKRGMRAIWIGILGICAAPIALPLALVFIILIACAFLVVFCVLLCIVIAGVSVAAGGIISAIAGAAVLFQSFADGLCNLGFGLGCFGAGLLFTYGSVLLFGWTVRKLSVFLGQITKGGRKK